MERRVTGPSVTQPLSGFLGLSFIFSLSGQHGDK